MDSRKRSFLKALSWRVIAFVITSSVVLLMTGSLDLAGAVGLADTVIKIGTFYCHERLWNRVQLGRVRQADYEI